MNIPSLHEEKKVDDQFVNDSCRIERLERLVEILCNDLFHVKEQQLRSQKQVLDLQADLAAAELAREDAERQMGQLQLRDHKLLLSLAEKQQQIEEETALSLGKLQHPRTHSMNDSSKRQNIDLIDVTFYEEDNVECEGMNEQVYHLDDIHPEESSCDQYMLQLWEDLSLSVQHLSSDLIEQRDAFEFVWTKFQLTNNQRMTALEDATATQLDALKDMAIEWDKKLCELNDQVQHINSEVSTEKISMTNVSSEMNLKIQHLGEQLTQLQSSVQRHMDYNRCINGERLVVKREHEVQLQKLHDMIQNINTIIHEQADQVIAKQSEPTRTCNITNHATMISDDFPTQALPVDENICVNNQENLEIVEDEVMPPKRDSDSLATSLTWPISGDDPSSPNESFHTSNHSLSTTTIIQRCQSY
jgi:hypothetical protein